MSDYPFDIDKLRMEGDLELPETGPSYPLIQYEPAQEALDIISREHLQSLERYRFRSPFDDPRLLGVELD